jgi:hypothetical protein
MISADKKLILHQDHQLSQAVKGVIGYPKPNRRAAVTDLGLRYHRLTPAI